MRGERGVNFHGARVDPVGLGVTNGRALRRTGLGKEPFACRVLYVEAGCNWFIGGGIQDCAGDECGEAMRRNQEGGRDED